MAVLLTAQVNAQATTWHVDDDQVTLGTDGTSWATAFKFLQDALTAAQPGDTIKVAQGIYQPDDDDDIPSSTHATGDQNASFVLKPDVDLFGGFKGIVDLPNADVRDPATFVTILSGDLNDDDDPALGLQQLNRGENSFSVVNGGTGTDAATQLNGFTIRDGHGGTFINIEGTGGAGVIVQQGTNPTFLRSSPAAGVPTEIHAIDRPRSECTWGCLRTRWRIG
jgi:hypothetical protein